MAITGLPLRLVGYEVRTADGGQVVGRVEGVRPHGLRIKASGTGRRYGYVPAELVTHIDDATDTLTLAEGIDADRVAGSPPPPDERPDGWHTSEDWWADVLGHYGLYDSSGRGSGPFLHAGGR
ncbi:hypothetical protein [Miltoncostaea marina]|uniref:hypothetical protein n=1 Tax=Miltoncostaea marina TaxID=2843215 RepID=UPI001C3DF5CD|nr:hypothetical protein [Miltoncostaea marina]